MSNELKQDLKRARKAQRKCNAFKIAALATGIAATLLGIIAAVAPPPWQVHTSMLKLIGEFMGIQCMFGVMVAFEAGKDAKLTHGNTTISIDGNGDDKVE